MSGAILRNAGGPLSPAGASAPQTRRRRFLGPRRSWEHRRRGWVLPLREAFPLQMDDFDRRLERELAWMLDRVVRTPAPPRRGHPGSKPLLKIFSATGASIAPVATVVVLADSAEPAIAAPALS